MQPDEIGRLIADAILERRLIPGRKLNELELSRILGVSRSLVRFALLGLHHALGWTLLIGALFPLARSVRPRSQTVAVGFALTFVVIAVMLYCDRDAAPIFGHISPLAGEPHR